MQPRWQDIPTNQLERIYNPRAAGPNVEQGRAQRAEMSAQAREQLADTSIVTEDIRYGSGAKQLLDLYQPAELTNNGAPLVVFIHGGYWRGGDKHESTLAGPALLDAGAVFANVNYDLCPDVTLDEMVSQIIRAVRFCHGHAADWHTDPNRLILIGHSAGAHLAARVMNAPADHAGLPANLVHSVVAISGIYEPEVITHISVNEQAQIDLQTARRNDCLIRPPQGHARYLVAAGGDEPAGWIEQSRLYAQRVRDAGFQCQFERVPHTDHFTVLCESFVAESATFATIKQIVMA